MATFLIHEDEVLKENACVPARKQGAINNMQQQQQQQQQRKTFGVLNNVQLGARAHAQKTTVVGKPLVGTHLNHAVNAKACDENAVHRQQLQLAAQKIANKIAATATTTKPTGDAAAAPTSLAAAASVLQQPPFVPVDAFKAFCVYENNDKNRLQDDSLSSLLDAPQAINNNSHAQHLETPMSVGEFQSPMSVDKTASTPATAVSAADTTLDQQLAAMREQRERFFDVQEYQAEILDYLKEAEGKHLPKYGYMRKQPDINHSMRTILVDWLVEVCEEYRLQSETLCLAVSYIDRFLSTMSVVRAKLQLVGTAAMFIAAKYEEIYPPDVNEFVYITDHTYTKKQVLRMEQLILKVLTFDLFVPTTTTFVNLYATMNPQDERVRHLTAYLCELSLLEADPYLQYVPSLIAAAAMAIARQTIGMPLWSARLQRRTGYTLAQLHDVLFHLTRTADGAATSAQQAIQDKYKSSKFLEVSTLVAEQPFCDSVYKRSVIAVSIDFDYVEEDEEDDDDDEDEQQQHNDAEHQAQLSAEAGNTTGVRQMISSLMFA